MNEKEPTENIKGATERRKSISNFASKHPHNLKSLFMWLLHSAFTRNLIIVTCLLDGWIDGWMDTNSYFSLNEWGKNFMSFMPESLTDWQQMSRLPTVHRKASETSVECRDVMENQPSKVFYSCCCASSNSQHRLVKGGHDTQR